MKPTIRRRASTIGLPIRQEESEDETPAKGRKRVLSFNEAMALTKWSSGASSDEEPNIKLRTVQSAQEAGEEEGHKDQDKEKDPLSLLPPPCTCPYFGETSKKPSPSRNCDQVVIVPEDSSKPGFLRREESSQTIVTWESPRFRRGSSFSSARTSLATRSQESSPAVRKPSALRRSATLRAGRHDFKAMEDAAQGVLLR